ncbi:MAG: hypothetical protein ACYDBJ_15555 [Aggregatilineales bacterium]
MSAFRPNDNGHYDKSESGQALADDPLAIPGVSFGVLIIGAIGWLLAAIAIVGLPWPMPGAQPTVSGPVLQRLLASVPDEPTLTAIARHIVDLGPFVLLFAAPIALVVAAGRRTHRAASALAIIGLLGIIYAAGMALYLGAMVAVCGFVLIFISGLLGWGTWIAPRETQTFDVPTITDENAPMSNPPATDSSTGNSLSETPVGVANAMPNPIQDDENQAVQDVNDLE